MAKDISKKDLAAKKARRAQKEMLAYMEENDLDPKKDWTGHKKHGKKIQAWVDIINLGNKKARAATEEKAVEKAKKNQKPEAHPKKEKVTSTPNAYDYPTVDGKEMTSDQEKVPSEDAYSSEDHVQREGRGRGQEVCCRVGIRCSGGCSQERRVGQGKEGRQTFERRQGQEEKEEKEDKERGGLTR